MTPYFEESDVPLPHRGPKHDVQEYADTNGYQFAYINEYINVALVSNIWKTAMGYLVLRGAT